MTPHAHTHRHALPAQVDIDISANTVANAVTGMVRGATTSLVIDIGIVLEGAWGPGYRVEGVQGEGMPQEERFTAPHGAHVVARLRSALVQNRTGDEFNTVV